MAKYKILTTTSFDGTTQQHIIKDNGNETFTSFPVDDTNPTYLEWVAEGNEPEPADE